MVLEVLKKEYEVPPLRRKKRKKRRNVQKKGTNRKQNHRSFPYNDRNTKLFDEKDSSAIAKLGMGKECLAKLSQLDPYCTHERSQNILREALFHQINMVHVWKESIMPVLKSRDHFGKDKYEDFKQKVQRFLLEAESCLEIVKQEKFFDLFEFEPVETQEKEKKIKIKEIKVVEEEKEKEEKDDQSTHSSVSSDEEEKAAREKQTFFDEMCKLLFKGQMFVNFVDYDRYRYLPHGTLTDTRLKLEEVQSLMKFVESLSEAKRGLLNDLFVLPEIKTGPRSWRDGKGELPEFTFTKVFDNVKGQNFTSYTMNCPGCKEKYWTEQLIRFNDYPEWNNPKSCKGRICVHCLKKSLDEKLEHCVEVPPAESDSKKETKSPPKKKYRCPGILKCPVPDCEQRDCHIVYLQNKADSWFEKTYKMKPAEFYSALDEEREEFMTPLLEEISEVFAAGYNSEDQKKVNETKTLWNRVQNNSNYYCRDQTIMKKLRSLVDAVRSDYYSYDFGRQLKNTKKVSKVLNELLEKDDYDGVYDQISTFAQQLRSLKSILVNYKSYLSKRKNPESMAFGMKFSDLAADLVEKEELLFNYCQTVAHRCSVCMTVELPKDSTMFETHTKEDYNHNKQYNVQIKCRTCTGCFDQFVRQGTALKRPMLTCPGMGCGKKLNHDHIKQVCPTAWDTYEFANLKFKLKRARDFKFCPSVNCGHGFKVYENCATKSLECPQCSTAFCPDCNCEPHDGSCLDFLKYQHSQKWLQIKKDIAVDSQSETLEKNTETGEPENKSIEAKEAEEMEKIEKLFIEQNSHQCPFCMVWIEKNGGCNHMTCHNCAGEFCWLCRKNWAGHASCEQSFKVSRPYFHNIFGLKVIETEEDESEEESDTEEEQPFFQLWERDFVDEREVVEKVKAEEYVEEANYSVFLKGFGVKTPKENLSPYRSFLLGFKPMKVVAEEVESESESESEEEPSSQQANYNNFIAANFATESEEEEEESLVAVGGLFGADSDSDSDSDS